MLAGERRLDALFFVCFTLRCWTRAIPITTILHLWPSCCVGSQRQKPHVLFAVTSIRLLLVVVYFYAGLAKPPIGC